MATILLIIIYLAFISLGLPDSMLGAAWPVAYAQLGAPVAYAGLVSVGITVGTVISSLISVRVIRRFGTGGVTAACVALTGGARADAAPLHPPADAQLQEYLEELRTRPEQRALFSLTKNATKEDVEKAVRIVDALLGGEQNKG